MTRMFRRSSVGLVLVLFGAACGGAAPPGDPAAAVVEAPTDTDTRVSEPSEETAARRSTTPRERTSSTADPDGTSRSSPATGRSPTGRAPASDPPTRSTSSRSTAQAADPPPTRSGAPWDIEAFEEYLYEPITSVDRAIVDRCGSADGGADCLVLIWRPRPVPAELRDDCAPEDFDFDPPYRMVEGPDGYSVPMHQRGTEVTIDVFCGATFDSLLGKTVGEFHEGFAQLCIGPCQMDPVILTGGVTEDSERATCIVLDIAYDPPPIAEGWHHPVLAHDARITVTTDCA